ncbi:hypothetical protein DL768_003356 [Monosporascus sp. mg162]|nr:hypothetical protein DL768_003356 [Monosporascus sp. mg162]
MPSTTYTKPDDKVGAISLDHCNMELGSGNHGSATHPTANPPMAEARNIPVLGRHVHRAPWEIIYAEIIASDEPLVEFYTKGGGVGTYHAMLGLVPDYDLVIGILTSGAESNSGVMQLLFLQIVTTLLPAIEAAGKDDSEAAFVGMYVDEATDPFLRLVADEWPLAQHRREEAPRHQRARALAQLLSALSSSLPKVNLSTRLYSSGLATGSKTVWCVAVDLGSPEELAQVDAQIFDPRLPARRRVWMDRAV